MRLVRRRHTAVKQPRPPWTWREQSVTGAPRTCMTNLSRPVHVRVGEKVLEAGHFDWALRLYRHHGATVQQRYMDIDGVRHAVYSPEEWRFVSGPADWVELVDQDREAVWRIASRSARKIATQYETKYGPRWVVPLSHYTKHEQE